jgi:hypothetical protein
VRPVIQTQNKDLPPPSRILVRSLTPSEAEVTEYRGILRQQPANTNRPERERAIARDAAQALMTTLVAGLRDLGLTIQLVGRGTLATDNDLLIDVRFLVIDQGNPLRRLTIGFGSGASQVKANVQVYQGGEQRKLLEFLTTADSGALPGLATTGPATLAIQGSASLGLVAGSAIGTGFGAYRSDVARMAAASGEQGVRYLSEFFAKQGWIASGRVKKARIAH